jgi:hypothetical protein
MLRLGEVIMRHVIVASLFGVLVVAGTSILFGQSHTDSSAIRQRLQSTEATGFVDVNGDGIDDRVARGGKGPARGKDRFVDQDGDGICDSRTEGLGFRRRAGFGIGKEAMKGPEGKAKGRRFGSGGKP